MKWIKYDPNNVPDHFGRVFVRLIHKERGTLAYQAGQVERVNGKPIITLFVHTGDWLVTHYMIPTEPDDISDAAPVSV